MNNKRSAKVGEAVDFLGLAVEFDSQLWSRECEGFMPEPPKDNVYWTVRLGRLALTRAGRWEYWLKASWSNEKKHLKLVAAQRFSDFEEAVRVATATLGAEPEHAAYMRKIWARP